MLNTTIQAPTGSRWEPGEVTRHKGKADEKSIPTLHLVFDTLDGAKAHFGEAGILSIQDGTSFRVWQDGVWRGSEKESVDSVCRRIIGYRPGTRGRTTRTQYIGADDQYYATAAEAKAASLAWAFDQAQKDQ